MKVFKIFISILIVCSSLLFMAGCEKCVTNTGDKTGSIYGVWMLDSKVVNKNVEVKASDFSGEHFYLCLNELKMAFGKTGSLGEFDLNHVDVDFTWYSYNSTKRQISFDDPIVLMQGIQEIMNIYGVYDVKTLSKDKLVITQMVGFKVTTYTFHKIFTEEE